MKNDTSDTPEMLLGRLNATFAQWINEQMKSSPNSDWSVAALEYNCHVENIKSAFLVEDPRVFEPIDGEVSNSNTSPKRGKTSSNIRKGGQKKSTRK
jgi:hypothetical protein